MKIRQVNSINFGYNKQLEKQLNEKIKKDPNKSEANLIKLTNDFCNKTETIIRKLEDQDETLDVLDPWYSILVDTKESLMLIVDERYPEINFQEKEVKGYEKELYKLPEHLQQFNWRAEIADDYHLNQQIEEEDNPDLEDTSDDEGLKFEEITPNHINYIVQKTITLDKNQDEKIN